jgi:hypothetical protein
MCIAAIGLIGAAVSAAGAMAQASSQAATAEHNAVVEKINARQKRFEGHKEQEQIRDKYARIQGEAIASAAKAGVDPGYGSAALVIFEEGGTNKSLDTNTAYINAESKAVAHENEAKQQEAQAKAARTAGALNAAGSFLGGLGGAVKGMGSGGGNSLLING